MVGRSGAAHFAQRVIDVLADLILVFHFLIVVFIVLGLMLVWVGALAGWSWSRNRWFRYLHLAAIVFVAAEALLGVVCPLTVWEDALRGGARPDSFIGRWVRQLLFYNAPEWVFTAIYAAWTGLTLLTLRLVPPARRATPASDPPV
jgi:polyferredoxin